MSASIEADGANPARERALGDVRAAVRRARQAAFLAATHAPGCPTALHALRGQMSDPEQYDVIERSSLVVQHLPDGTVTVDTCRLTWWDTSIDHLLNGRPATLPDPGPRPARHIPCPGLPDRLADHGPSTLLSGAARGGSAGPVTYAGVFPIRNTPPSTGAPRVRKSPAGAPRVHKFTVGIVEVSEVRKAFATMASIGSAQATWFASRGSRLNLRDKCLEELICQTNHSLHERERITSICPPTRLFSGSA